MRNFQSTLFLLFRSLRGQVQLSVRKSGLLLRCRRCRRRRRRRRRRRCRRHRRRRRRRRLNNDTKKFRTKIVTDCSSFERSQR